MKLYILQSKEVKRFQRKNLVYYGKKEKLQTSLKQSLKLKRQENLTTHFCGFAIKKQRTIEKWTKSCIVSFLKTSDLGIIKNNYFLVTP